MRARAAVKAHTKEINCLAVSPNGALIATGSQDKTIGLWRLNGAQLENAGSLVGHRRGVWSIAFSPADQVPHRSTHDVNLLLLSSS